MPVAVTGLLIDAAWNNVVGVTESLVPASFTPKPPAQTILPPEMIATLIPGTLYFAIRSVSDQRCWGRPSISTAGRRAAIARATWTESGTTGGAEAEFSPEAQAATSRATGDRRRATGDGRCMVFRV